MAVSASLTVKSLLPPLASVSADEQTGWRYMAMYTQDS